MHYNSRRELVYGSEDDNRVESDSHQIARTLSNPEGNLKLTMKPHQVLNWMNFLLEEVVTSHYKKLTYVDKMEMLTLDRRGLTPAEIGREVGFSKTRVKDFLLGVRYNHMLNRAHNASKELRVSTRPEWGESCH